MDRELWGGVLKHEAGANHDAGTWVCRLSALSNLSLWRPLHSTWDWVPCCAKSMMAGLALSRMQVVGWVKLRKTKATTHRRSWSCGLWSGRCATNSGIICWVLSSRYTPITTHSPTWWRLSNYRPLNRGGHWSSRTSLRNSVSAAKHNANTDALLRLLQVSTPKTDVFEELTKTTRLPANLGINVLEAGIDAAIVGDGATGTVPSSSPADMRTHTNRLTRLYDTCYGTTDLGGVHMPRNDAAKRKQQWRCLAMSDKLIEREGVLYRRIATPAGIQRDQRLLPATLREHTLCGLHYGAWHQGIERTETMVRERCYSRGMVAREGFVYTQKPLSVKRNVAVWEGWSLVRVVVRQGFYCTGLACMMMWCPAMGNPV